MQIVHGSAAKVDCEAKEATIIINSGQEQQHRRIQYDYLIAATGLRRTYPTVPQSLRRKNYLQEVGKHVARTEVARDAKDKGVVVIGGGELRERTFPLKGGVVVNFL